MPHSDEVGAALCAEFKQFAKEIIRKGEENDYDPSWTTLYIALDEACDEEVLD